MPQVRSETIEIIHFEINFLKEEWRQVIEVNHWIEQNLKVVGKLKIYTKINVFVILEEADKLKLYLQERGYLQ